MFSTRQGFNTRCKTSVEYDVVQVSLNMRAYEICSRVTRCISCMRALKCILRSNCWSYAIIVKRLLLTKKHLYNIIIIQVRASWPVRCHSQTLSSTRNFRQCEEQLRGWQFFTLICMYNVKRTCFIGPTLNRRIFRIFNMWHFWIGSLQRSL